MKVKTWASFPAENAPVPGERSRGKQVWPRLRNAGLKSMDEDGEITVGEARTLAGNASGSLQSSEYRNRGCPRLIRVARKGSPAVIPINLGPFVRRKTHIETGPPPLLLLCT
jgi:hypothetical protein